MKRRGNSHGNSHTSLSLPKMLEAARGNQDCLEIYEVKESSGWDVEGTVYDVYLEHHASTPHLKGATEEELIAYLYDYFFDPEGAAYYCAKEIDALPEAKKNDALENLATYIAETFPHLNEREVSEARQHTINILRIEYDYEIED